MSTTNRFTSVWDAIEDTPQTSASMKARSTLMMDLRTVIEDRSMTQAEAAILFGVTQPRISDLVRGKINLFSLDTLMDMAATAGMSPTVKVTKPRSAIRRMTKPATPAVPAVRQVERPLSKAVEKGKLETVRTQAR